MLSADNQQGRLQKRLEPWYISGFVDGEGSFHVALYKERSMRFGWKVIPEFHVSQRVTSRAILDRLVEYFQCGYVKANHKTNPKDVTYVYVVRNRNDLLTKIIPFFKTYVLQTEKAKDFELFEEIVRLMSQDIHKTEHGLRKIVDLAYAMNGAGRYRKRSRQSIL